MKLLGVFWQNCNIVMKKGKLTLKMVGIGQASVFHLHRPNGYHSIDEKGSYPLYMAEPRRERT
jgi:hypothetical protein